MYSKVPQKPTFCSFFSSFTYHRAFCIFLSIFCINMQFKDWQGTMNIVKYSDGTVKKVMVK